MSNLMQQFTFNEDLPLILRVTIPKKISEIKEISWEDILLGLRGYLHDIQLIVLPQGIRGRELPISIVVTNQSSSAYQYDVQSLVGKVSSYFTYAVLKELNKMDKLEVIEEHLVGVHGKSVWSITPEIAKYYGSNVGHQGVTFFVYTKECEERGLTIKELNACILRKDKQLQEERIDLPDVSFSPLILGRTRVGTNTEEDVEKSVVEEIAEAVGLTSYIVEGIRSGLSKTQIIKQYLEER